MNTMWLTYSEAIATEYRQCLDEGLEVQRFENEVKSISEAFFSGHVMEQEAKTLWEKLHEVSVRPDFPYVEPFNLEAIKAERCLKKHRNCAHMPLRDDLYRSIYGAWLGRCAGCLFGQPVEGWMQDRIISMMKDTGNYPPHRYFSSDVSSWIRKKYDIKDEGHVYGSNTINWINNVEYGPEDDDTNYTILNLKTVEEHGKGFTSENMAESWLMNLQFLHACTAERIAYRNFYQSCTTSILCFV